MNATQPGGNHIGRNGPSAGKNNDRPAITCGRGSQPEQLSSGTHTEKHPLTELERCGTPGRPMQVKLGTMEQLSALAAKTQYSCCQLARQLGLSERQLRRRFHQQYHCSPGQWLHWLRMRRALELQAAGLPHKVVAIDLGYNHASNYLRARKRSPPARPAFRTPIVSRTQKSM